MLISLANLSYPFWYLKVFSRASFPPALPKIQLIDYRQQDRQAGIRLARALSSLPSPKPLPVPLPPPLEVFLSYLGSLAKQVETTSKLSYQEQSGLVVELRRSLLDSKTSENTRILLEKLRT